MISLWQEEAAKYNVLPLDDRRYERAADPGRPVAAAARETYTFYPHTSNLHPLAGPQLLGKEHTIAAHVTVPKQGADGVLASFGGKFGGWSFFVKDGKLCYVHNYLKIAEYAVSAPQLVTPGKHTLTVHFTPTAKSLKPDYFTGDVVLFVDGKKVAELDDIRTGAMYSAMTGYGLVVGRNTGTPVTSLYDLPFAFTGTIDKIIIDLGTHHQREAGTDEEAGIRIAMHQD